MPELQDPNIDWDSYYSDYVAAYLERDVRDLVNVKDEAKFYSFMVACAARTGRLLNATDIGNTVDVDRKTVKAWLSVLQASNIIRIVGPFWPNVDKRLSDVWFYRDQKKREIDLLIQEGHILHPVEVKTSATVGRDAVKNFTCLESLSGYEIGFGHVVCQTSDPYLITKDVQAVPVWSI